LPNGAASEPVCAPPMVSLKMLICREIVRLRRAPHSMRTTKKARCVNAPRAQPVDGRARAALAPRPRESADIRRQHDPTAAATPAETTAPKRTRGCRPRTRRRAGSQVAVLTVARKIGRRAYHVLRELDEAA
jgi:hypothetical protein